MKHIPILSSILALFIFAAAASGQMRATLTPDQELAVGGGKLNLTLTLEITADTSLDATLVNGVDLDVKVDDKSVAPIKVRGKGGKVEVVAGTRIERTIAVDLATVIESPRADGFTNVSFNWPSLTGANALVKVAPDVSGVAIEDLDLAKTKVVLVTNHGNMTLAFRPDKAPKHVENFFKLTKDGFYNGTEFHRVIKGFMIQGGCPNTKEGATGQPGTGNPGYTVDAEFNDINHVRGTMSMARSASPNSAGCQFFICHKDAPHLNNQYTAFGALEKGADVLDSIGNTPVGGPQGSTPVNPVELHYAILLPAFK